MGTGTARPHKHKGPRCKCGWVEKVIAAQPKRYKFRPVTLRERERLATLMDVVRRWGQMGHPIAINVPNVRNSNGYSIEWQPFRQEVKVSRFISQAWAKAHGYEWKW